MTLKHIKQICADVCKNQTYCKRKRIYSLHMLQPFYNMIEDQKNYYLNTLCRGFDYVLWDYSSSLFDKRCLFCVSGFTYHKGPRSHFQSPGSRVLCLMYHKRSRYWVSDPTFRLSGLRSWVPPISWTSGLKSWVTPLRSRVLGPGSHP